jgi:tripartite-type tricarboxylate transporter receptor subunit TctC
MMRYVLSGVAAMVMAVASVAAYGQQQYPSKSVRVIVPFSPGGGTDVIGRLLAAKLSANLAQQFVVDNRAGAGSTIGTEIALKSPPDGYTLLLTGVSYTVSPSTYKLRYDPLADMTPIARIDDGPFAIVVHPSLPARNVKQLVALAKTKPGQIVYATSGQGSISHLSTEWFAMLAGIRLMHIPYKGTGQSVADTVAGHIQLMFSAIASAVPHVKSGRLIAIAVTAPKRIAPLPDVPTVIESGYDMEVNNWHGMVGPKGMPPAIVDKLNAEINSVIKDPEFVQRIAAEGLLPAGGPPERMLTLIRTEIVNWARVVKHTGLKAE